MMLQPVNTIKFVDWSKLHEGHTKKQEVIKETHGRGPDLRIVACLKCLDIYILGPISDQEVKI